MALTDRARLCAGIDIVTVGRPEADLEAPGSFARAIASANPDVVINCAASNAVDRAEIEPERAFRMNAAAAGEIAGAAAASGAAVVQISSDYVFDGNSGAPYREDALAHPLNAYGRSKLAAEEQVRQANPNHLILRTAWLFSPYGTNFVKTVMRLAAAQDEISVVADQRGSPSSASDVADGLLAALSRWQSDGLVGLGEVYHLAGTGEATWFELAVAVSEEAALLRLPAAVVKPIPSSARAGAAVRPADSRLDSSKFSETFSFRMPHWRESLSGVVRSVAAETCG